MRTFFLWKNYASLSCGCEESLCTELFSLVNYYYQQICGNEQTRHYDEKDVVRVETTFYWIQLYPYLKLLCPVINKMNGT